VTRRRVAAESSWLPSPRFLPLPAPREGRYHAAVPDGGKDGPARETTRGEGCGQETAAQQAGPAKAPGRWFLRPRENADNGHDGRPGTRRLVPSRLKRKESLLAVERSRTMRCRSAGMLIVTLGVPLLAIFWPLLTGVGKDSLGGSAGPNAALAQTSSPPVAGTRPDPEAGRLADPFREHVLAASPAARAVTRESDGRSVPMSSRNPGDDRLSQHPTVPSPTLAVAIERLSRAEAQPREVSGRDPSLASGRLVPVSAIAEAGGVGVRPIGTWNDQSDDGRRELAQGQASCARGPRSPASPTDLFSTTQQRLRQLGATYFRLETYGEGGEQFRFQCRITSGRGPGSFRDFEAIDGDPLQAMAKVLGQVQEQADAGTY
jgi:hypothetical protein